MPIYSCSNGKYRIGDGECIFTTREAAQRAYVGYLADHPEEANKKADSNKVSFDYDGTISKPKWQEKAMSLKESGKTVYIVTRRQDSDSEPVYAVADKIGIPHSRVYFTNGKMKWETIKRLGIGTHYDNNPDEIKLIRENTDAIGLLVSDKLFDYKEETYNDYPESATNNAKKALKYKEENGSDCGTPIGWTRARQLANREKISRDTIARMASFKRHQQHADVPYSEGCGGIMWDAWGGTSGIEWAIRKLNQIDNNKNTDMLFQYKSCDLQFKDVDAKKGIVQGYFSAFGNIDSDGDVISPGAFKKTIQESGPGGKGRIFHLQNHNPNLKLGKLLSLEEDAFGLKYESQIGKHALGVDFIKMIESDLINEHSIGFQVVNNLKKDGYNEITEVKLWEGSSLTAWGANENTPLTSLKMKGFKDVDTLKTEIKKFEKFIRDSDATDETINMCLLKVWQLAQAVELLSSTPVVEQAPESHKDSNTLEMSLIKILNNY